MPAEQPTLVKFVKHSQSYNVGEIAGFPPDQAARLIAANVAVACDSEGNVLEPTPLKQQEKELARASSARLIHLGVPYAEQLLGATTREGKEVSIETLADYGEFLKEHGSIAALTGFGDAKARTVEESVDAAIARMAEQEATE